jgi:hypothetical protein
MKQSHRIVFALFVVGVLSALASASAFAAFETAKWLAGGTQVSSGLTVEGTGGLTFENVSVGASFLCEGLTVGTVEPNGAASLTEFLSVGGEKIESLDESGATKGFKCVSIKLCEGTPEAWPVGLPFLSVLALETTTGKFSDLSINGAFFLLCQVLGIDATELCEPAPNALSGGNTTNLATDVEGNGSGEPLGTCNGTVEVGSVTIDTGNLASLTNGQTLAASE